LDSQSFGAFRDALFLTPHPTSSIAVIMEVIGAVASIVTLTEVFKVVVELQHHLLEAPSEIERSLHRVQFAALELRTLIELERSTKENDEIDRACATMLKQCCHDITRTKDSLASATKVRRGKRLRWALVGRARIKEFTTELACLETSLNVILSMRQRYGWNRREKGQ
jgi:hypothetical protein